MHAGLTRCLFAVAGATALLGMVACADPDDSGGSSTTVVQISATDTQTIPPTTAAPPPQPGDVIPTDLDYEVKSGDTVYGLASRYSVDAKYMADYNEWPEGIQHPLYAGAMIKIPPNHKEPVESTTTTTVAGSTQTTDASTGSTSPGSDDDDDATSTTVNTAEGGTYVVKDGDYLAKIAKDVGSTIDAIVAANNWSDGSKHVLIAGDSIKIP